MTTLVTYTINATDAVTGAALTVHFPAVSELMARAWAELCFKNNAWSSISLYAGHNCVWSTAK